jgi:hypothetical protein
MAGLPDWLAIPAVIVVAVISFLFVLIENTEKANRERPPTPRPVSASNQPVTQNPIHKLLIGEEFQQFMRAAPKMVMHEDRDRNHRARMLVRVLMREEQDIWAVLVHDTTLSHVTYLRVPPDMKTCHEAVAWTFGMTPEEFRVSEES